METGGNKESKAASSNEAVSSPGLEMAAEAGEDDAAAAAVSPPAPAASIRPYYECVFCKRGFTTAQALGGHMNIHRRDRAKPGRDAPTGITVTSVSRNVECYNQYQRHLAYPPTPPATTAPISSSSSFAMYYRSTGAAPATGVDGEAVSPSSGSPRELSLFGADARDHDLHLGLGCHGPGGDGSRTPEGSERQAGEPERELDLELRLGRRPRH